MRGEGGEWRARVRSGGGPRRGVGLEFAFEGNSKGFCMESFEGIERNCECSVGPEVLSSYRAHPATITLGLTTATWLQRAHPVGRVLLSRSNPVGTRPWDYDRFKPPGSAWVYDDRFKPRTL